MYRWRTKPEHTFCKTVLHLACCNQITLTSLKPIEWISFINYSGMELGLPPTTIPLKVADIILWISQLHPLSYVLLLIVGMDQYQRMNTRP